MIIEGFLNVIKSLLTLLFAPIDIPSLPDSVATVMSSGLSYLLDGLGIFAAFTHYQYIMALFAIVIAIDAAMLVYKFIMWILRKIPAAGIE